MPQMPFSYVDERFADIQMLRYQLKGFHLLGLRQKQLVYYLSQATLYGRDITFDQYGKYNLVIRKTLEAIYVNKKEKDHSEQFQQLTTYLKRLWFSNGIHHHYGCMKFTPGFSPDYLLHEMMEVGDEALPLLQGQTVKRLFDEIRPVIFNPEILAKRVNKEQGVDLILTSACHFYEGVTQQEVETFYQAKKNTRTTEQPSWGLNSTLVKENGELKEQTWMANGKYGEAIRHIVFWLEKAVEVAENEQQKNVIEKLIRYYNTGDLRDFDDYSIEWVNDKASHVDFINGFIEVYGDPLALKGTWEGIVEYVDEKATLRTKTISDNAQWFEDNSPVDPRFKKKCVKGVSASVICAAMLGGEEYPASAIGINLPNAEWIRERYGSKSVTIGNLTEAYNQAAKGSGMRQEFVVDEKIMEMLDMYDDACDDLHTDLHECLGHGSGQLLPDTNPDALKEYASTIEEARADLFAQAEVFIEANAIALHIAPGVPVFLPFFHRPDRVLPPVKVFPCPGSLRHASARKPQKPRLQLCQRLHQVPPQAAAGPVCADPVRRHQRGHVDVHSAVLRNTEGQAGILRVLFRRHHCSLLCPFPACGYLSLIAQRCPRPGGQLRGHPRGRPRFRR